MSNKMNVNLTSFGSLILFARLCFKYETSLGSQQHATLPTYRWQWHVYCHVLYCFFNSVFVTWLFKLMYIYVVMLIMVLKTEFLYQPQFVSDT
jgi:hypothetical protein